MSRFPYSPNPDRGPAWGVVVLAIAGAFGVWFLGFVFTTLAALIGAAFGA